MKDDKKFTRAVQLASLVVVVAAVVAAVWLFAPCTFYIRISEKYKFCTCKCKYLGSSFLSCKECCTHVTEFVPISTKVKMIKSCEIKSFHVFSLSPCVKSRNRVNR